MRNASAVRRLRERRGSALRALRSLIAPDWLRLGGALIAAGLLAAPAAYAQPAFSKAFAPGTIGPGGVSTLIFTITNGGASPVSDLAFTDNLPAAVTVATPANTVSNCGGTLSAPGGSGTITFSGGGVGANSSCTISVNVTSSTPGTHSNVAGDLTSSAGNSGGAQADLTVAQDRPGFSKSFTPSSVNLGGRSRLTFVIDNTSVATSRFNLTFVDNLPAGMEVAGPANASTDCTGGILTAVPGSGVISYGPAFSGDASVGSMASCTVGVDVIGNAAGMLGNTSGELTSISGIQTVSSGSASAVLEVTVDTLSLSKSFTDDPVLPGGTVDLEFTVNNFDRNNSATNITFTDDLDAALSGLVATGLPASNVCGAGSQISGTGLLSLTGGNLGAGASCTFSVTLQVPAGAVPGVFPNTTSSITGDLGGSPVTGSPASDNLFVQPAPLLTKEFRDAVTDAPDPVVGAGSDVIARFTITNTSTTSTATDIAFTDNLSEFLSGIVATSLPASGFCGAGSVIFTFLDSGQLILSVSGANLAASDSCTFDVTFAVPVGGGGGVFTNRTGDVTATVDAMAVTGAPAEADLTVAGVPRLTKVFTDDPVDPGGTATLEFTLEHSVGALGDASGISFTDDLAAALSGLAGTGLPLNDICGTGSSLTGSAGDTQLTFTGGTLMPGEACTFNVTLAVPAAAPAGTHTNTTSSVTATTLGVTATGSAASDDLSVAGVKLTKEFTDDPVIPGGTVTLRFTVENISPTDDATGIAFTDNLFLVLSGLVGTGLPLTDPCGAGSALTGVSGNTSLSFSGGSLLSGETCTFDVTLNVPVSAPEGSHVNATSIVSAIVGGNLAFSDPAADELTVSSSVLLLTKEFTDDPVAPGGMVNLRFTLTNMDASQSATAIAFTDDLDAALSGLTATGLPFAACGGTVAAIPDASTIDFSGGSLGPGASCQFDVAVTVPAVVPAGSTALNMTSGVTGMLGGLSVTGDPASDELRIDFVGLTKRFLDPRPVVSGTTPGVAVLEFTIENLSSTEPASELAFSDDLDAVVPGLIATGLPMTNICGSGSAISGSSLVLFTGGNLMPGGSCTFTVTLSVPAGTPPGVFPNTTGDLNQAGLPVGSPATANLVVNGVVMNTATATADGADPTLSNTTTDLVEPVEP